MTTKKTVSELQAESLAPSTYSDPMAKGDPNRVPSNSTRLQVAGIKARRDAVAKTLADNEENAAVEAEAARIELRRRAKRLVRDRRG